MNDQLIPVPFYDDTLVLADHAGQPFVAMKPIVENMGLDWKGQHVKLAEKFGPVMEIISTTGADGKQYEMVCLPLRKIPAFLYSVNRSKVKPELRDKIARYQDECDDALWNYWTKGSATRQGAKPASMTHILAAHRQRLALLKELKRETAPAVRRAIHEQLDHASRLLGLSTPALIEIGQDAVPDHASPVLEEFWENFDSMQQMWGGKLNHSRTAGLVAFSMTQLRTVALNSSVSLPEPSLLRRLLKASRSPRFVGLKAVNSAWGTGTVRCWVFSEEKSSSMEAD